MCSQIDKPLRFQEISHIEEHITLPPRGPILFHRAASAFGDRNVIALALMANFPPFRLPFSIFGDSDLLSYMFEQTYRELASPSAKLCGLRQQKATDSKGALLSYATFFARTHNGLTRM